MKLQWMKKGLAGLLCAGLLLGACACDENDKSNATTTTTTTTNTGGPVTPPPEGAVSFESYTEILTEFRSMLAARITDGMSGLEDYPRPQYADERSREIGSNLLRVAYNVSPKKMCYATRDLDGNGIPELILLSEDYELSAIFTLRDSKPVFLDVFFDMNHLGAIDKDGYVFKSGYSKGESWYKTVEKLEGGELKSVVTFGCTDNTDAGGSLEYYMITPENGRVSVPESEIDAIETMYRPTFSKLTEITFEAIPEIIPFFNNLPENTNSPLSLLYREVLCDNVLVYEVINEYHHAYGKLSDAFCDLTRRSFVNIKFTMLDMDGDGVNELVLRAPLFETVVIYYEDGVFYAHSITSPDWLWTDGTVSYHNVHGYWGSKLSFHGSIRGSKRVYEVIWGEDGSEDELYVGGEAVTEEAFNAYMNSWTAEKVTWYDITPQNIALYVAANDIAPKIDFSTYDDVIESYRIIATMAPICYEAAKDGYEPSMYDNKYFDLPDDADERKIFTALFDAVNARYKSYYYRYDRTELLYAYKDLNGDGADELLLFTEEYEIMAIFTLKDGKPNLLKYDTLPRSTLWVDADGYIRMHSSGAGGSFTMNVWTIVDGELKFVEGAESGESMSDQAMHYYALFDAPESSIGFGWKEITEVEYNALLAKYDQVSAADLPEYLKANLKLDEHKLFPTAPDYFPAYEWLSTRYPNLDDGKRVTVDILWNEWFLRFHFLPREEGTTSPCYDAPIALGENRFADECSFATDKLSGTLSFGGHTLWLTVEHSEFEELPVGVYLFYDNSYYSGK